MLLALVFLTYGIEGPLDLTSSRTEGCFAASSSMMDDGGCRLEMTSSCSCEMPKILPARAKQMH